MTEPHQGPHEYRCVECGVDLTHATVIDIPDHAPSVAAPQELREAGQALSDAIADMAAERRLFVDAAVRTDIRFLDALKAFRAALRAESVAAPVATICECGLAKSYHVGSTNLADHEYRPRHAPPALDAARLAEALFETERPGDWPTWADYVGAFGSPGIPPWKRMAERLIAAYERAATPASGEPARPRQEEKR